MTAMISSMCITGVCGAPSKVSRSASAPTAPAWLGNRTVYHSMYLGVILLFFCMPVALGS